MLGSILRNRKLKKAISILNITTLTLAMILSGIPAMLGSGMAEAQGYPPNIRVNAEENNIWGYDWQEGSDVSVEVKDGDSLVFQDTAPVGDGGEFWLHNIGADIQPGNTITVTQGDAVKNHVVTSVKVTNVDKESNTVSGTTDTEVMVTVYIHVDDGEPVFRNTYPDSNGEWSVDFSQQEGSEPWGEPYDFDSSTVGWATQFDGHGDATQVEWFVEEPKHFNPFFFVSTEYNDIWGHGWDQEVELTITIGDFGSPDFQDTVFTDEGGSFDLWEIGFNIEAGQLVTVTDGTITKEHIVTSIAITHVDIDANTVSGVANPGSEVHVGIGGENAPQRNVTADSSDGTWTADFSEAIGDEPWEQAYDIGPGTYVYAMELDDDGDGTHISQHIANPFFVINDYDYLWGDDWLPDSEITITVFEGVDQETYSTFTNEWGSFNFELWDFNLDITTGDVITVSDGTNSRTHVVKYLEVTEIDVGNNIIYGQADEDSWVEVEIHEGDHPRRLVQADGDGNWEADFSTPGGGDDWHYEQTYDIGPGTYGSADRRDENGNATRIHWQVSNPVFRVNPLHNYIWGHDWKAGNDVTITVGDTNDPDFIKFVQVEEWGDFGTSFGDFTIEAGHFVTVTDGVTTKEHTVTSLWITEINPQDNTISGTAEPGSFVGVNVYVHDDHEPHRTVEVDEFGNWTADFSEAVGPEPWDRSINLEPGMEGAALQSDDEGDETHIGWFIPNPFFQVMPVTNRIFAMDWLPESEVTIKVGNPADPDFVMTTDTDEWGSFDLRDINFNIQAGQQITLTDGESVKSHTVTILTITEVNTDTNTISGTADPGSEVEAVFLHGFGPYGPDFSFINVTADGSGNWSADFGTLDINIRPGDEGAAWQRDEDGDYTAIEWRAPRTFFFVAPGENRIMGFDWEPDATVTVKILDGSDLVFNDTAQTNDEGIFSLETISVHDIQAGNLVIVNDGTREKEHTVLPLAVTEVDPDSNTISGTAQPGSLVELGVGPGYAMEFQMETNADGNGNWTADLDAEGFNLEPGHGGPVWQSDEDGDQTVIHWQAPEEQVPAMLTVDPENNSIMGSQWPAEIDVNVTIFDSNEDELLSTTVETDEWGFFDLDVAPLNIEAGHMVRATHHNITKEHIVKALTVTEVDVDNSIVYGTATPDTHVGVNLVLGYGPQGPIVEILDVNADGQGNWEADFGAHGIDLDQESEGHAWQMDEDGDQTIVFWQAPEEQAPVEGLYGDVNDNGTVDIGDAILVLRHIVGLTNIEEQFGPEALARADVTGSGDVNINDAIHILKYIVGVINEFPVEVDQISSFNFEVTLNSLTFTVNQLRDQDGGEINFDNLGNFGFDAAESTATFYRGEEPGITFTFEDLGLELGSGGSISYSLDFWSNDDLKFLGVIDLDQPGVKIDVTLAGDDWQLSETFDFPEAVREALDGQMRTGPDGYGFFVEIQEINLNMSDGLPLLDQVDINAFTVTDVDGVKNFVIDSVTAEPPPGQQDDPDMRRNWLVILLDSDAGDEFMYGDTVKVEYNATGTDNLTGLFFRFKVENFDQTINIELESPGAHMIDATVDTGLEPNLLAVEGRAADGPGPGAVRSGSMVTVYWDEGGVPGDVISSVTAEWNGSFTLIDENNSHNPDNTYWVTQTVLGVESAPAQITAN